MFILKFVVKGFSNLLERLWMKKDRVILVMVMYPIT